MKVLLSRIHNGKIFVDGRQVATAAKGLVVFIGIGRADTPEIAAILARKVADLRIFEDDGGRLHFSLRDKAYNVLCVPNFTLQARTSKGRRPSFDDCMDQEKAAALFELFVENVRVLGVHAESGIFGSHMDIQLELDGPINIVIDSQQP
jgi:D-aminoacyl-tRNA deacylase